MRCLLGRIGSEAAADSDVKPRLIVLHRLDEFSEREERIELKFRIYDGTDIGHSSYSPSITVATLKKRLLSEWPQAKTVTPKTVNEVKLIHGGKVLENCKTLAESRIMSFGNLPGSVITMHVVVQPTISKEKKAKNQKEMQKMNSCSCTIL